MAVLKASERGRRVFWVDLRRIAERRQRDHKCNGPADTRVAVERASVRRTARQTYTNSPPPVITIQPSVSGPVKANKAKVEIV